MMHYQHSPDSPRAHWTHMSTPKNKVDISTLHEPTTTSSIENTEGLVCNICFEPMVIGATDTSTIKEETEDDKPPRPEQAVTLKQCKHTFGVNDFQNGSRSLHHLRVRSVVLNSVDSLRTPEHLGLG
jgi:hypothetical protein